MTRPAGLLHLDTHVVVWLAAGEHERVPAMVRRRLAVDTVRVSPMVRMELDYLRESGRLSAASQIVIARVASALGMVDDQTPLGQVIGEATLPGREWHNRDPFDRVIVAQALAAGATLVTKDAGLRAAFPDVTVWD